MAIVVTEQTLLDADAYFLTRLGSEGWTAATAEERMAAITTAARVLNSMTWRGTPLNDQAAFPRYLPTYDRLGSLVTTLITPTRVLWALYEQALHLINNKTVLNEEDTVESLVLGPISLDNIETVKLVPKIVQRYIAPYVGSSGSLAGGQTWWRAN